MPTGHACCVRVVCVLCTCCVYIVGVGVQVGEDVGDVGENRNKLTRKQNVCWHDRPPFSAFCVSPKHTHTHTHTVHSNNTFKLSPLLRAGRRVAQASRSVGRPGKGA